MLRFALISSALLIGGCQSASPANTNATSNPLAPSSANASFNASPTLDSNATASRPPSPSSPPKALASPPPPKGFVASHLSIRNVDRTFGRFVPDSYDGQKALPLVFVLHGDGGTGESVRKQFTLENAANGGAIFVYPDGLDHTWMQAKDQTDNDDFFFFDALVAQTSDLYRVDTKKIFVTGFSSGAYMANQLGCFRGGTIRAIAPNSGGGPYDATGKAYNAEGHLVCNGKPVAAMMIHGDRDSVVAFAEGQKSLAHWMLVNQCANDPKPSAYGESCASYSCAQPVVFCTLKGQSHQLWSDAPADVWKFFASFP